MNHKRNISQLIYLSGGSNLPGEHEDYDFGSGAGFYVDATEELWKNNYRMYSYVTKEVFNIFKICIIWLSETVVNKFFKIMSGWPLYPSKGTFQRKHV